MILPMHETRQPCIKSILVIRMARGKLGTTPISVLWQGNVPILDHGLLLILVEDEHGDGDEELDDEEQRKQDQVLQEELMSMKD